MSGSKMTKLPLAPWRVNSSTTVIKDRWIDLRAEDCTTAAGVSISPYYVLRYPDWVHIVCVDSLDRICVIWQYRHGAARNMMELPGGVIEPDEEPLDGAKRELREETGIRGTRWRGCGTYRTNPATHTNNVHVFACRVDTVESTALDAAEDIRQEFLTLFELRAAIDSGDFGHLLHVGALCRALNLI
jgi:8-oxo-dGTP pyrophosphatase MutT (NUDIX family)